MVFGAHLTVLPVELLKKQQIRSAFTTVPALLAMAIVVMGVFIASSWNNVKDVIRGIKIPLPSIIPIILRQRASVEVALNHLIKLNIYELVRSSGLVPFSKILEVGGKSVVMRHTFISTRSGLIIELKIDRGRRRKMYLATPDPRC